MPDKRVSRTRKTVTILLVVSGAIMLLSAFLADSVGVNTTPGFGVIQVFSLLMGISSLTLAAFLILQSLRPIDAPRSLQADIGIRLGATGLVFCYVTGLSDLIGIGTHVNPNFNRPFIGPLQFGGIVAGLTMIVLGLLLYYTSRGGRSSSSLEFLVSNDDAKADPPESEAMSNSSEQNNIPLGSDSSEN